MFCEILYRICAEFYVFSYPAENRYTAENWYSYPTVTTYRRSPRYIVRAVATLFRMRFYRTACQILIWDTLCSLLIERHQHQINFTHNVLIQALHNV